MNKYKIAARLTAHDRQNIKSSHIIHPVIKYFINCTIQSAFISREAWDKKLLYKHFNEMIDGVPAGVDPLKI